ncbi:MAG: M28 family peptidase [Alphaproteobacteria bacterium]|nr:M28 family peptidase [Alphaproteobacteria bacterium]MBV9370955.1 M28 family peptidase [Alphaproteobacteria bacterium]MBV9899498.1 M28 family peptidase [Alphaproteobacteria bacterium]
MIRLLAAAALPVLAASAAAAAPGFDPARLSRHVRILSSDEYQGRGPATAGETKAVDYIVAQMKAAGLQPGGAIVRGKRGWTQDVPLLRASIEGSPALAFDLGGRRQAVTQGEEIAVRAALTGAHRVTLRDAPLVFVGYGVKAPERNWDDFKGVDLKGKVMVVLVNDPDFEAGATGSGGDFGGKAMTYYGRWTYKYEEAARQGAAGVLVVHETAPAAYGWATVKNSNTNTMFDILRSDPAAAHAPLEGWIQRDLAVALFRASGLDFDALKRAAQSRDFGPVPLKPTFSADYAVRSEVITSHNVVGRVPGAKRPDETVIYSAHWDHLGVGRPDARGDRIYNGAVDNATGIAALIEMGRAFAKGPRPARSVVFLAVTAEEKGLLGSEYYASNPLYPLARTAGVLNMDALGVAGPARNFSISGSAKLGLLDDLVAEGRRRGRVYTPEPHPEHGSFYRSDHFPMAKRGVPAVSFDSGNDLLKGGTAAGEAAAEAYTRDRYHQPADEWSADWDLGGMTADLALLHAVGARLANSRQWPNWSEDSEFRATRDATAAERR